LPKIFFFNIFHNENTFYVDARGNCMNISIIKFYLAFFITCLLSACGGGGSGSGDNSSAGVTFTGNTSPAEINETTAKDIGETSGEAILQASTTSSLPGAFETVEQIDLMPIHLSVIETSKSLELLPSGIDVSAQVCTGGGSANVSSPSGTGKVVQTITYNNCTLSSGLSNFTIDGTVIVIYENISNPNAGFSLSYQNVTVSGITDQVVTINYTFTCTNLSDTSSCVTSSVFKGSDGNTHKISNFEISGTSSFGYNGTASFSHYSIGTVSVSATNLTYGSCSGSPDGGSISFTSSNGSSGTITFNSNCTVSGTWNSGTVSGSF
jgi:hypothetical protein